jgi:hypothetical protein
MNNYEISSRLIFDKPSPTPIKLRMPNATSKASDKRTTLTVTSQNSKELPEMLEYCSMISVP